MATRTISNAGGNYNSTGTWVEGIVPTSADDVVSTSTSGQLTINVVSAALSINLSNYTNTLTMNANWTISGTGTHTLGSSMNFAGTTGALVFSGSGATITQNTTNRIPILRFTNFKTLATNLYCVNYENSNLTFTVNGFAIYISGNIGTGTAVTTSPAPQSGTTKMILDGSGLIAFSSAANLEINTTGTYSTYAQGLILSNGATFSYIAGNFGIFNTVLMPTITGAYSISIDCSKKIDNVYLLNVANFDTDATVNLTKTLFADNIITLDTHRFNTTDSLSRTYIFRGNGLSASNLFLTPFVRTTSSTTVNSYTYRSINLKLNSDYTHKIGAMMLVGGYSTDKPLISSVTASSVASINLLSKTASQIVNYNFQDINATGQQIVAIGATLSNTTNITNVYPSGSSVSGGSWTFVQ